MTRDQRARGQLRPWQRIVTRTPFGARTVSRVTRAPFAVSRPRIRTTGAGRIVRGSEGEACTTGAAVGIGVATGVAGTSNVGTGVGVGVASGVGVGVGDGVGDGVGV